MFSIFLYQPQCRLGSYSSYALVEVCSDEYCNVDQLLSGYVVIGEKALEFHKFWS